ncbi:MULTISPECIES: undecaprenyl-diphosphate phosphatase [Peptoniphilus]|uniref:undecaprenyl-diphosphate phosphatase n=1 Tax=Peptoniphilus TaxID=162289 RepID=UPI0001DAA065|nr:MULTISPECIES: undecaprenyl-diphosphate phosphatase [Peptoniphilus]EFI41648.1 undecaprenyl-diphosphatase UppP [Peptoniphilus sp. oral taxon 386 str. F0131]
MDFLKVIILGIIEGITEFLPISSTGHLILASDFISLTPKEFENAFEVIIQLGAILSVLVIYFDTLNPFSKNKMSKQLVENQSRLTISQKWFLRDKKTMRLIAKIIVGFLPAAVLGFLFDDLIDKYLFNKVTVSLALVFYGAVIILMENRGKKIKFKYEKLDSITIKTAFFIGVFQCLAMVPGTSRSAATIIGAMILGCSRTAAAEFSFFLAIPTMLGATSLKILKMGIGFSLHQWILILVGGLVSFLVAYAVIIKFMGYIKKHDFKIFGIYRIILGAVVLISMLIFK